MSANVFIIDDDEAVRDALALLCDSAGFIVETFDSAQAFLDVCGQYTEGCLVLDLNMPDMSGIELQENLVGRGVALPIIFLSAYGDVPTTARAMKAGAMDFLTKPVAGGVLLTHIREALSLSARLRVQSETQRSILENVAKLTEREKEVLVRVATGASNKEIAQDMGISYRTVEIHRANAMHKVGAANLLELARIVEVAKLHSRTP
ncbi:MAG TPA: response regulator [Methylophilaceae bacterium]|nr:response regulator [Methylophilaceae bacterium]HQR59800.1 response regulator [Methylophilaceae bacterium]